MNFIRGCALSVWVWFFFFLMKKDPCETYLKKYPEPFKMAKLLKFRVTSSSSSVLLEYSPCNGLAVKSGWLKEVGVCQWGSMKVQ